MVDYSALEKRLDRIHVNVLGYLYYQKARSGHPISDLVVAEEWCLEHEEVLEILDVLKSEGLIIRYDEEVGKLCSEIHPNGIKFLCQAPYTPGAVKATCKAFENSRQIQDFMKNTSAEMRADRVVQGIVPELGLLQESLTEILECLKNR